MESLPAIPIKGSVKVECQVGISCLIARIDGAEVSPSQEVVITAGAHEVEVGAPGFAAAVQIVDVEAGAQSLVAVELRLLPARVTFFSTPPGAKIRVDGRLLNHTTPAIDVPLEPGVHSVELGPAEDRYRPLAMEQRWQAGGLHRVVVTFEPWTGQVRFSSDRVWDRLELDGELVEVTENQWLEVTAGRHRVIATAGRHAANTVFEVTPDGRLREHLAWRPMSPDPNRYVLLPATGEAKLGSPNYPDHNAPQSVELDAFWIGRTEVTVSEYRACVETGNCRPPATDDFCNWRIAGREGHPINCVSAIEAEAYAGWLSDLDGLEYRLPTSEQWERAARGTGGRRFPWGESLEPWRCNSCDQACPRRWRDQRSSDGWSTTAPVGALRGCRGSEEIYDMVGNVAEWCREADEERYGIRGGSWGQMNTFLDPAFVAERPRDDRQPTVGFRLLVSHLGGAWEDD